MQLKLTFVLSVHQPNRLKFCYLRAGLKQDSATSCTTATLDQCMALPAILEALLESRMGSSGTIIAAAVALMTGNPNVARSSRLVMHRFRFGDHSSPEERFKVGTEFAGADQVRYAALSPKW